MLHHVRSRGAAGALAVAAFAGGILAASGMGSARGTLAATQPGQTATPSRRDVKPVADLSDAFITIAESVTPAVVSIQAEKTSPGPAGGGRVPDEVRRALPYLRLPDEQPDVPEVSSGSGFVIDPSGLILTNNHVVAGADRLTVVLQDNRQLQATLVGRDPNTDVAVIRVSGGQLPAARLGRSEGARIGEWVLAIGNPLDLGTTVTSGIVSAKGRALGGLLQQNNGNSPWAIEDFIQTDAPINPGNSGGPLVNLRGEVVGVNSAIASSTGFYAGYGFAIPIDLAKRIADDLVRYGRVRRPALGVQVTEVTPEDAVVFKLPRIYGVVAQAFPAGSAAQRAGLRAGDVIVAVGGTPIEHVGQFQRLIAGNHPGDEVTLDVVRYGTAKRMTVKLMEAPSAQVAEAPAHAPATPGGMGGLGISAGPLTGTAARQLGYTDGRGVLLAAVTPLGAGYRAGLRRDMRILAVDGRAVASAADLASALGRRGADDVVSLIVGYPGPDPQQAILNVRLPR